MKKGEIVEVKIDKIIFPGKASGLAVDESGEHRITVGGAVPGQRLKVRVTKKRRNKILGQILEVVEPSPQEIAAPCPVFGRCGGCAYQNLPYENQLTLKADYVQGLMAGAGVGEECYQGMTPSPKVFEYRNKMEFSFGDDEPGGELRLGMHQKGSFYNIVDCEDCQIVDGDFRAITAAVLAFFKDRNTSYFHKRDHQGFLRHLVVRKGERTGEILINLVTTSQENLDDIAFVDMLQGLILEGKITGILQTINDQVADAVICDELRILYGEEKIHDEILGLDFEISTFSFFQTNTSGAEKLYALVRDYVGETKDKIIFDLYSGTGTIAQVLAPVAKKVVGIEIVADAVAAAKANAAKNGLTNCEFIAGDVLKTVDQLTDKPDIIILDPPRDGIHPKAIFKIIDFRPDTFIYVACKATSLARDIPFFTEAGYVVDRYACVDLFPHTGHTEAICLLTRKD